MTHLLAASLLADLPVHCLQPQIVGRWTFRLGRPHNTTVSCGHDTPNTNLNNLQKAPEALLQPTASLELELRSPNIARASDGRAGRWTMVYDEGFEVELNGTTFFAFSAYAPKAAQLQSAAASDIYSGGDDLDGYVSHCDRTLLGWYRGAGGRTWGCYYGTRHAAPRATTVEAPPRTESPPPPPPPPANASAATAAAATAPSTLQLAETAFDARAIAAAVNARVGGSWRARPHAQLEGRTVAELQRLAGGFLQLDGGAGRRSGRRPRRRRRNATALADLPRSLDWRRMDGLDWDRGARRYQGLCGSCYAIAVVEMLEARLAIRSGGRAADALSVASITRCSPLNQGCAGGYPYLAAKHAAERGVQRARCFPDEPAADAKPPRARCAAAANASCGVRASSYGYVGGYYGGCSERAMMEALLGGPIVASFFVAADFMVYSSGTYSEAEAQEDEYHADARRDGYARAVAPWRKTSHSVLLVGWGEAKGGERDGIGGGGGGPYWIARNSWGDDWGEDGYFRIRRGTDECGVESMAVTAEPEVPPLTAGAGMAWTAPARRQGRRPRRRRAARKGSTQAALLPSSDGAPPEPAAAAEPVAALPVPHLSSLPAVEGAEGAPSLDPVDGAEVDERTLDAAEPPDAEPAAGGFGWNWT